MQYLSHDRADLGLAAAVLATRMAKPKSSDVELLRRTVAYLRTHPSLSVLFEWGSAPSEQVLNLYSDSDWASCQSTRRSRSGGTVQLNGRTVAHWCRHQDTVSLSSGEAELRGIAKAGETSLGIQSVARDLGLDMAISIFSD